MSIKLMTSVWDAPVFRGNTKLIMLCLADFANDEGVCWPSHATIAKKCTLSVSTVKAQIRQLIADGFLAVKARLKTTDDGKTTNDSNCYQIVMRALKTALMTGGEIQPGAEITLGQNSALPGAKSDPKPPIDPPEDLKPPKSPPLPDGVPSTPERREARRRKTPLPADFAPNDAMRQWYAQQGFVLDPEPATAQWADAMRAGDYRYVDWISAWRNGMRKQNQWAQERGGGSRQTGHSDDDTSWIIGLENEL